MIGAFIAGLVTLPVLLVAWELRPGLGAGRLHPAVGAGWTAVVRVPRHEWDAHVWFRVATFSELTPEHVERFLWLIGAPGIRWVSDRGMRGVAVHGFGYAVEVGGTLGRWV